MCVFEEVSYERLQSAFIEKIVANAPTLSIADDGALSSVSLSFVLFDEALDKLWAVRQNSHWDSDIDMERRKRTAGARVAVIGGWHNVEAYSIPPKSRFQVYLVVPV